MRIISIKLPPALDERLTQLARRGRTTRLAVVREALLAYGQKREPASVTSAAGDLVGTLSGPKDLSTSREHMAGYGR